MAELTTRTVEIFYSGQWHDITADTKEEDPAQVTRGIANEGGSADAGSLGLTLQNGESKVNPAVTNRYATRNPMSDLFGLIGPNTPIRLSAGLVGDTPTVRTVQEVVSWPPRWDVSERDRWVPLQAAGVLRRLGVAAAPLDPALTRAAAGEPGVIACWPLAGLGQHVTAAPSAVAGVGPMRLRKIGSPFKKRAHAIEWSADSTGPGLGACPAVRSTAAGIGLTGPVPGAGAADLFGWSIWGRGDGDDDLSSQMTIWVDTATTNWVLWLIWRGTQEDITVSVEAYDDAGSLEASLSNTVTIPITDEWVNFSAVVEQSGSNAVLTVLLNGAEIGMTLNVGSLSSLDVGTPKQVRATALLDAGGGMSFAAPAVVRGFAADAIADTLVRLYRAGRGHDGEPAGDRVGRLCLEQGVALTGPGVEVAADTSTRTESNGWGDADTGQEWTTSGGDAADYSVSSGRSHIEVDMLNSVRQTFLDVTMSDVDVYRTFYPGQLFTGAGFAQAAVTVRTQDIDNLYQFVVQFQATGTSTGQVTATIGLVSGGTPSNLAQVTFTDELVYDASSAIRVRGQLRGNLLRMKVWDAAEAEPVPWVAEATDSTITAAGSVGVRMALHPSITNGLPLTMSVDDLLVLTSPHTAMMGPQRPGEFLGVLGECAKVEAAGSRAPILVEQQAAAGLHFNALTSLYLPRTADLTLDWAEAHISPPFEVTPDDFGLANDVTAGRPDGGEHRTVITTGPRGVDAAGRVAKQETFGVASDVQLASVSGWWAWHGTHDEDRYPTIRINMRSLSLRTDGPALVAAVQALAEGALIAIANPPAGMPAEDIEQIVLGITETITVDEWLVDLHTTAARPFLVAVVGDQTYGVTGSDSTTLGEALDTTEAGVDIHCGAGDDWVHEGTDYDIQVGGERMTVTAAGSATGTFPNRTQTLTVVRSVNGIVKAHATGSPVEMWHQTVIGPWG